MIHDSVTQPNITRKIPSASVACTRYHGWNTVSISTKYTRGMDNLNFIAIRISKSSKWSIMDKQAVTIGNPPQTVCRMLTLLAAFCKYIFWKSNQGGRHEANYKTSGLPWFRPCRAHSDLTRTSHPRRLRFSKKRKSDSERKLRVLAALELQRKKPA